MDMSSTLGRNDSIQLNLLIDLLLSIAKAADKNELAADLIRKIRFVLDVQDIFFIIGDLRSEGGSSVFASRKGFPITLDNPVPEDLLGILQETMRSGLASFSGPTGREVHCMPLQSSNQIFGTLLLTSCSGFRFQDIRLLDVVRSFVEQLLEKFTMIDAIAEARDTLDAKVRLRTGELERQGEILAEKVELANRAEKRAEESNLAKSQFLANMSHELRTPLGVIKGFAELLLDAKNSDVEKESFVHTIIRNSNELVGLVDEVLDLSKVEAGKMTIEKVRVNLPKLVNEIRDSLLVKGREKNIDLRIVDAEGIPPFIETDPSRLKQILLNIVGNGIKFCHQGSVSIQIQTQRDSEGNWLHFQIHDTGIGMSEAERKNLFRPFTQANASTTREFGGTGLGLALSKKLAIALGGDLVLLGSEIGKGSSFLIVIPLEETDSFITLDSSVPAKSLDLQGMRVLLADDSEDNQLLIGRFLSRKGAQVEIAQNGEQAIEYALNKNCDVVLMDINMPRISGYDATAYLRSQGFDKPIIALTAFAMKEEEMNSKRAGCNEHLTKPVNFARLTQAIRRLADSKPGFISAAEYRGE